MHEDQKLEDAADLLDEMIAAQNDPSTFRRKLAAFLSAARSVLQYAHKAVETNSAGLKWYEAAISKSRFIALMRDQRNTDVHHEPVRPDNDVDVKIAAGLSMTGELGMVQKNAEQEILGDYASAEPIAASAEPSVTTAEYTYFFKGNRAAGDIISLSKSYLTELRKVVAAGRAIGFLT